MTQRLIFSSSYLHWINTHNRRTFKLEGVDFCTSEMDRRELKLKADFFFVTSSLEFKH